MGEGGQKAQASSYELGPGDAVHSVVTVVNNPVLRILKIAKRIDLKSSHHKN